jgi:membrane protease YdiL (CAAX protease family)
MNMDGIVAIGAVVGLLLVGGGVIGLVDRRNFHWRWLLVAAGLVLVDDALLTRVYGLVPDVLGGAWNWQGKLLALAATLAIAALPAFGWRRVGLTLAQEKKGRTATYVVAVLLCLVFAWLALMQPTDPLDGETLGFQLTMPGLEEEAYYRGTLLLALDMAFRGRVRFLGADWGWSAILSCALFGLGHGFGYSGGAFSFDWMTFALTGGPALILVWMRARTGSLVLPVLLHNFANSIGLLI